MSVDPLERAARAIWGVDSADAGVVLPWEDVLSLQREPYLAMARAAIASLREPTPEMVAAWRDQGIGTRDGFEAWAAALDEILR